MNIKNKIALVTGASGAIGKATAISLAKDGYHVIVTDLKKETCDEVVEIIHNLGYSASSHKLNVREEKNIQTVISTIKSKYDYIDLLVNVAGIVQQQTNLADCDMNDFDNIMDINFRGTYLMMKYVLPLMVQHNSGNIINVSSIGGIQTVPKISTYSASKKAVIAITEGAAAEYYEYNIKVNAICPGSVQTPLLEAYNKPGKDEQNRAKKRATPENIADVISFLASDKAKHISGVALVVDGGRRLLRPDLK